MSDIKLFENKKVRSQYDAEKEIWYFSIVDIMDFNRPAKRRQSSKLLESFEK